MNLHNIAEDGYESIATSEARKYLPLVIGYTSGLNDLLSMPFIDLQDFYAQQVAKEATTPKQSKRGKSAKSNQKIQSPNLLMLNYDSNSAIVISNLLLGEPEKIKILQETTKIERLDSFRIVIRWNKLYTKRKLEVTNELQRYIDDLIECAALKDIKKEPGEGEIYTLDFKYSDAVRELFRKKFNNSLNLFEALTKLNLLNTLCIQRAQREKLRKRREKGQLLKFPQVASLDKIFGIEDVKLILKLTDKHYVLTEYEKISDGEHQFMHIAGGILLFDQKVYNRDIVYLLDEFDTHFNPIWRSDFFYKLESLLKNKDVEFLITTHSPFILSDCHGYNVLKFTREGDKITFERVTNETYGSTFENILESVFRSNLKADEHFNNQMAKLSFNQIQSIYGKLQTVNSKDELQELFKEIKLLGESIDRLQILKEYAEIEKRFVN